VVGNATVGRAFCVRHPARDPELLALDHRLPDPAAVTGRTCGACRGVVLRHWRLLALYTVLGVAGCNILTYTALHDTTAVNSSLINSTTPIF